MALVRQPTAVTITFKDRNRNASTGFYMKDAGGDPPSPIDLANPNALAPFSFVQELYDNMKDVSDCAGVGYSVTYTWAEEPSVAVGVTGNPDVNRKGVFQFETERGARSIFTVPGIKIAALAANGRNLYFSRNSAGEAVFAGDVAGDLQSIHDKLRNGATIGVNTFAVATALGDDFQRLADAYQQNRASSGRG